MSELIVQPILPRINAAAHRPEMDYLTPAQTRVVCEQLLYTMDIEQRGKFKATFPGLYRLLYP